MASLPEEVQEEILLRMPVKSLLAFKTASKKWYSLISKDHKFHMKQSSSSKNLILYKTAVDDDGSVFRYSDIDTCESRKFIFPIEIAQSCYLIGSANGLICLGPGYDGSQGCEGGCFIWNPCTGECKTISFGIGYVFLFGFGYDSVSDDYKILGSSGCYVSMFSFKTRSWKMLAFSGEFRSLDSPALHWCGALHWCVTGNGHITAFDLAKDTIFFIELPKEMKLQYWRCTWLPLFDYQGSLCTSDGESIWVMREYGNAKSWAKFSTSLPKGCSVPIGISRLGEVVCRTIDDYGVGFVKFDTHCSISDDDKSRLLNFPKAFIYSESLISPKCLDPK